MKDGTFKIFFCAGCYLIPCNFAILSHVKTFVEMTWNDPYISSMVVADLASTDHLA